jgi:hypothetical protein
MKNVLIGLVTLFSLSAFAESSNYTCKVSSLPIYGDGGPERWEDIGIIQLKGDITDVAHAGITQQVKIDGIEQALRPSKYDSAYLYLYDALTGTKTYALEFYNFKTESDRYHFPSNIPEARFGLLVYGSNHVVSGLPLAKYNCVKSF